MWTVHWQLQFHREFVKDARFKLPQTCWTRICTSQAPGPPGMPFCTPCRGPQGDWAWGAALGGVSACGWETGDCEQEPPSPFFPGFLTRAVSDKGSELSQHLSLVNKYFSDKPPQRSTQYFLSFLRDRIAISSDPPVNPVLCQLHPHLLYLSPSTLARRGGSLTGWEVGGGTVAGCRGSGRQAVSWGPWEALP